MLRQKCRSAVCSITRVVNTAAKESMIHNDYRKWTLPNRNLHDAGNRQSIAGISDQIRRVFLVFIERGTNVDFAALEIMPSKSIDRVWKDQLLECGRRGRSERQGCDRGRSSRPNRN